MPVDREEPQVSCRIDVVIGIEVIVEVVGEHLDDDVHLDDDGRPTGSPTSSDSGTVMVTAPALKAGVLFAASETSGTHRVGCHSERHVVVSERVRVRHPGEQVTALVCRFSRGWTGIGVHTCWRVRLRPRSGNLPPLRGEVGAVAGSRTADLGDVPRPTWDPIPGRPRRRAWRSAAYRPPAEER